MTIARIDRACVRHYRDNKSTVAYVEWTDVRGKPGRTEAPVLLPGETRRPLADVYGLHMGALLARAICQGIEIERETW